LTWDQRREQRRKERLQSRTLNSNLEEIKERRRQRTEKIKAENAKIQKQLDSDEQARKERARVREERRQSRDFEIDPEYIQRINDMVMLRIAGPPSPDFTGPVPLRRRSTADLRRSLSSLKRASSIASGESLRRVSDLSDPAISDVVFETPDTQSKLQNDYESSRSSGKRQPSGSSKMSEETNQVPEIVETPAETIEKVELEEQKATTDLSESTVKEIHEETAPEPEQSIQEIVEDSVPEAQQKEELIESENIGSVNNRLSRYQSKAQQSPEVKREPVPKSVSSIDHFKDNYLKQTEKTGSSVQSEMATAGALSLKDRMKMFESQSSKSVQREVVGQAERAGDIRSKISNWGSSEPSNSNNQRERITVAPLSERRSQYTAVANAN